MKHKDILLILISSFILTLIWIGFSLYSSAVTSTISETQGMQITGIASDFNQEAVNAIKNRTVVPPIFESQVIQTALPTPSPSPDASETFSFDQPPELTQDTIATPEADIPPELITPTPIEETGIPNL